MVKAPAEFINDLKHVFQKHGVIICVTDEYDGEESYRGSRVEIKSLEFINNSLPIYIYDLEWLKLLMRNTN